MYVAIVRVRRISPSERRILHRMKRQRRNTVNSNHARIILLSSGRVNNREIAQRVGYSPHWVRQIIHRFNRSGVGAIQWYPYWQARGMPRKFFADLDDALSQKWRSPHPKP